MDCHWQKCCLFTKLSKSLKKITFWKTSPTSWSKNNLQLRTERTMYSYKKIEKQKEKSVKKNSSSQHRTRIGERVKAGAYSFTRCHFVRCRAQTGFEKRRLQARTPLRAVASPGKGASSTNQLALGFIPRRTHALFRSLFRLLCVLLFGSRTGGAGTRWLLYTSFLASSFFHSFFYCLFRFQIYTFQCNSSLPQFPLLQPSVITFWAKKALST